MNLSDAELILYWQQGDEASFEVLYKRYASRLLALAMRKTDDRAASEEFVNDAFLKFYNDKSRASSIQSVEAYLATIMRNKIIDHFRHVSVQKKYEEFHSRNFSELDFTTINQLEVQALKNHIELDVDKLPFKCKTVFKLSRFSNLSNKEIAQVLGISENTVEQHMRKALKHLRSSLLLYGRYSTVLLIFAVEILG